MSVWNANAYQHYRLGVAPVIVPAKCVLHHSSRCAIFRSMRSKGRPKTKRFNLASSSSNFPASDDA